MAGGKTVGENYAFAGMHHIFDDFVGYAGECEEHMHLNYADLLISLF